MNRRSFLSSMLKGVVACAILPSALTYKRQWIPSNGGLYVPMEGIDSIKKFSHLPFYLVKNQVFVGDIEGFFDKLFGTIEWKSND